MTKSVLIAFCCAATAAFAVGRWDGQFVSPAGVSAATTSAGADACVSVPAGKYIKTVCNVDAYVGAGILKSDAGTAIGLANQCALPDAGVGCARVLFSIGEVSYQQLNLNANRICFRATDAGVATCSTYVDQGS